MPGSPFPGGPGRHPRPRIHRPGTASGGTGWALNRLLIGALAGIAGTVAMTAAMRAMHRHLPARERYALPPREIIAGILPEPATQEVGEEERQALTLAAHFGYGAATGALYRVARAHAHRVLPGALYGVLVWAASYFVGMPGLRILKPAHAHPLERNLLMIAAHLVWGGTLALTIRELELAERQIFAGEAAPDARLPRR